MNNQVTDDFMQDIFKIKKLFVYCYSDVYFSSLIINNIGNNLQYIPNFKSFSYVDDLNRLVSRFTTDNTVNINTISPQIKNLLNTFVENCFYDSYINNLMYRIAERFGDLDSYIAFNTLMKKGYGHIIPSHIFKLFCVNEEDNTACFWIELV